MLTNDRIVLKILKNNKKRPLSAYDVLDKFLRIKRVQPATVYRSLKNLMEQKLIHRLNQSKKYIVAPNTTTTKPKPTTATFLSAFVKNCKSIQKTKISHKY